jgi:2,3,4,5-tetrahydropyridine-2-carboxylate N-succinyltransferase
MKALDTGAIRVATPSTNEEWEVHEWIKKAILLYFAIQPMATIEIGPFAFYDKIPVKNNFKDLCVRAVPPAIARYGSCLQPGVILMACYVNIGAYVGENTMIDIGAAIGSCAQIGRNIHVSAGAIIGGVLEPPQARPVIVEDGAFIGANTTVVEGVVVGKEAVLGAHVILTSSTKIFDVSQAGNLKEYRGYVPPRAVVIAGTYPKAFPAGVYGAPCALIIGQRTPHTDLKTSLNETLRKYDLHASP